jgi:hypothetical protein
MVDDVEDVALRHAERVIGLRVGKDARQGYKSKLNTVKVFLVETDRAEWIRPDGNIIIPLSEATIHALFGWLAVNENLAKKRGWQRAQPDPDEDEEIHVHSFESGHTITHDTMQSFKSSLLWAYGEEKPRVPFPPELNKWCQDFIHGYKKEVAAKKAAGIMPMQKGKLPLSFHGYLAICQKMVRLEPVGKKFTWGQGIFSWCYMVLCWNIMSRSINVGALMMQHMDWENDCLKIIICKHKGDATGEGLGNMKHVYVNLYNPDVCPILSLALLTFKGGQISACSKYSKETSRRTDFCRY